MAKRYLQAQNTIMEYSVKASSNSRKNASIKINQSEINFGITPESSNTTPNPAELFLGSFSSCILKKCGTFWCVYEF